LIYNFHFNLMRLKHFLQDFHDDRDVFEFWHDKWDKRESNWDVFQQKKDERSERIVNLMISDEIDLREKNKTQWSLNNDAKNQ
jgi:hypothetical protein